ncbi:MAG: hypothetical protein VXX18_01075 [Bacteroidota bacterium]|nr:hypothetical protein [Bacteroidota bacterium]MEC8834902.1 hypothetical protein [Bacteroidota bacterium]
MKKNTFIPLNDQASKALKGGKTTIEAFDQPSVKLTKVKASKVTIEAFDQPELAFNSFAKR